MRSLVFLALMCVCTATAHAQATTAQAQVQPQEKDRSNLEKFSSQSGTLLERQFVDLGSIRGVKVRTQTITNLISKISYSGLRFEMDIRRSYGSSSAISVLDGDEAEALLRSLKFIKSNVLTSTRTSYTEVFFNSRGGFEMGCYYSSGQWTLFMKVSKYERDSMFSLGPDELNTLILMIEPVVKQLATVAK
jgi:hypothetical protein